MVTSKDVAKHAGVSTATVSRVINDDPRISQATKEKVRQSIDKLGYKLNTVARSLKMNKTHTIGFITPEIANEFFMKVAQGAEKKLKEKGYSLIIVNSSEDIESEKENLKLLDEKRVDGIIAIPTSNIGKHFSKSDIPIIFVDRKCDDSNIKCVSIDNVDGAYKLCKNLLSLGGSKIGFIGGNLNLSNAKERFEGYKKALKDSDVKYNNDIVRFGDFHFSSGYELAKDLIENHNVKDIFVSNEFMHSGVTKYLIESKRNANIVSFDDMGNNYLFGFVKATYEQPIEKIGEIAFLKLLSKIESNKKLRDEKIKGSLKIY